MLGFAWAFGACYVNIPKLAGFLDYDFIPGYALCHVVYPSAVGSYAHYSTVITLFLIIPTTVAILCYLKSLQKSSPTPP